MSFPAPPDFPITPILRGRDVNAVKRDLQLQFKPPFASTPKARISTKASAKDTVIEKGKAAMTLRQQNETAAVKQLKSQNCKSSDVPNLLQSKPLGNRNQPVGVVPVTSEVKNVNCNTGPIQMNVKKLTAIGKAVSTGIERTNRGDDQSKPGGQVEGKASLVVESKDVGNGKVRLGLRSGRITPLDNVVKVASGPRKVAVESGMQDGKAPGLDKGNEIADNNFGLISKQGRLDTLHEKSLVHEVTETTSRSPFFRTGSVKAAVWKTLTSQAAGSKGLASKDERSGTSSAQVNSDSALRSSEKDSAVGRNPSEIKSLTRASNSRSLKTTENKLKDKSADKVKSVVAQTTGSMDTVKTTAYKSTRRVSNVSAADKERISVAGRISANVVKKTARKSLSSAADVSTAGKESISASTVSRLRVPGVKTSAMIAASQVAAPQASTIQSVNSERLTAHVTDSVLTKSDSTHSHGNVRETSVGSARPTSVKRTARKRVASAEISSVLENSGEISDDAGRSTEPNNKLKKRKVVVEDSRFADRPQTERRFFKQKISKPKNLLPNSSQEKVVKQAQHINRRKSIEQKDVELKVKPKIYQHWKVASKPTLEFAIGTLVQSFEEKFNLEKLDMVDLVNYFEELKNRIASEVSLVKVPTSRHPVNYLALTTQESTLALHLDESVEDVEHIGSVIRNCEGSNKKLKILKEHLQSKSIATTEAGRPCEAAAALEMSQSTTHGSLQTTEQSNASETQEA